jgi:Zn-dependent protease with chaperone function
VKLAKITRIKEFGKRVYLTFRLWLIALVGVLILSVILGTGLLFFIPLTERYVLVSVYLLFTEIMAYPIVHLIVGSTGQIANNLFYNRKHTPKEHYLQNRKQIAKKMHMEYDKPVYITDNPSITSPFTNLFSRKIYFSSFVIEELHTTEIDALFGHELAHIKYGFRFVRELLLATLATWGFAVLLAYFAIIPAIYVIAEFAFMMLVLSFVMRRNESLADWAGGNATTPEALISVLDYFRAKCKGDGSTITHPSFQARKKRLERLFDSDR